MAALDTFTLEIDGTRLGGTPETAAKVTIRTQRASGVIVDPDADLIYTPHPSAENGLNVALPYTTTLVTDVASSATVGTQSETLGYEITVAVPKGKVTTLIAAQRAGDTVNLADLAEVVVEPISTHQAYVLASETARDEAEAAAASIQRGVAGGVAGLDLDGDVIDADGAKVTGGGAGVSDHGALTGLADDDHPQYALADGSRGTFATTAQGALADSAVQPGDLSTVATTGAYADLSGQPTIPNSHDDIGAAPAVHTHVAADVTDLSKSSVGLGNVDNTSDANKPVSTATQTALDAKLVKPATVADATVPFRVLDIGLAAGGAASNTYPDASGVDRAVYHVVFTGPTAPSAGNGNPVAGVDEHAMTSS